MQIMSDKIYKSFELEASDKPFIETLKYTSYPQYQALMATQGDRWTSYKEFARELDWPTNTFKTRLHRAKHKIVSWRLIRDMVIPL